jgi:putative ABC transport system substrate-binding protein
MNTKRYLLLSLSIWAIWSILLSACTGQPATKTIGVINLVPALDTAYQGFQEGMLAQGYSDENLKYIYPGAVGDPSKLDAAAQALINEDVDMIFCITTPACLAAKKATAEKEIPVVFVAVTDPVVVGLVQDYTQPGDNVTGVTVGARGATNEGRRLQLLVEMLPSPKRIYIPLNPDDSVVKASLPVVQEAAEALGVELVLQETRTPDEVKAALAAIPDDVDAMFVFADQVVTADLGGLVQAALDNQLPLSTPNTVGPQLGALMSFGSDFSATGKQAARICSLILKGTKPADVPVESPEFFLNINLKTAGLIGLEIPESVLRQAANVIR